MKSTGADVGDSGVLGQEVQKAHDLFGLPVEASMREIRATYHRLAHRNHPDKHMGLEEGQRILAEQRMKAINVAYEVLRKFHS